MEAKGRLIAKLDAPAGGRFVAPHIFRVSGIEEMEREIFGPVLHVATFRGRRHRPRHRIDQPQGVRPDFRPPHAHRSARAAHRRRHPCRQHLRQPQPDRRGRRLAALRRRGAVGHRAEGRRPALSQAFPQVGFSCSPASRHRCACRQGERRGAARTICPTPRWAAGPRVRTVLPCFASICAARAPLPSQRRPSVDFGPVDLPGPTGEANTLTLAPRGRVLCLGPDAETLLAQAIQALAAGNAVLAVAPGAPGALQPLTGKGLPIAAIDGTLDAADLRRSTSMSSPSRVMRTSPAAYARRWRSGPGRSCRWSPKCFIRPPMRMNARSASTRPPPAAMPACWRERAEAFRRLRRSRNPRTAGCPR